MIARLAYWLLCSLLFALMLSLAAARLAKAAGQPCGDRARMLAVITGTNWLEVPMVEFAAEPGATTATFVLYANLTRGTWTVVRFPAPAVACFVAAGKSIRILPASTPGTNT